MPEDTRREIVRRAKWAAFHLGKAVTPLKGKSKEWNRKTRGIYIHKVKTRWVVFFVVWNEFEENLRLGATVYHEGGDYPSSIGIVNTYRTKEGEYREIWHDKSQNELLLAELRRLMLLEDIAGV